MLPEGRLTAAFLPALASLVFCGPGCRDGADAHRCAADRTAIEGVLQPDQRASELLRQADALAVQRRSDEAARLVDAQVVVACDQAIAQAGALQPQSRWGRAKLAEAFALLEERRRSARTYAEALRSGDAERVLDQMQAQKAVEQKALTVRSAMGQPPPAGECEP